MNTGLVRYGLSMLTKQYTKKTECKIRSGSRGIAENNIFQWLIITFGIFRQLAAAWRRIAFVYDDIGNMAGSNKR